MNDDLGNLQRRSKYIAEQINSITGQIADMKKMQARYQRNLEDVQLLINQARVETREQIRKGGK